VLDGFTLVSEGERTAALGWFERIRK
jgi:hypothetical protein